MRYGIREVCDMKFYKFVNGIPTFAFEIDSAKTSTLETATTTVYAQGGTGNSRLMAWEGERTLTFTVEDALFTPQSLAALMGTAPNTSGVMSLRDDTFSGYYKIEAVTLIRDENGEDKPAQIIINKAKLQSNLNLPMSPTGDPVTFTFTFDAFPVDHVFLTIQSDYFKVDTGANTITTVTIIDSTTGNSGSASVTGSTNPVLAMDANTPRLGSTNINVGRNINDSDVLTNGVIVIRYDDGGQTVVAGSTSTWYIV